MSWDDSDEDWDAGDVNIPDFSNETGGNTFDEEEDLSLKQDVVRAAPKEKKQDTAKMKKAQMIAKKEEEERKRQARLEAALNKVQIESGVELSERAKAQLVVEQSDNLLCEDLFGGLVKPKAAEDEDTLDVIEGEDLMGGGGGDAKAPPVPTKPKDPTEAFEEALRRLPLKTEEEHIMASSLISAKLNKSGNSTSVVQFIELLIKAVHPTLDSTQYKKLSSACNVQKNKKQKEEQVGKKKKKKSKKKVIKMQHNDDFMMDASYDNYGYDGYDDGFM